MIEQSLHLKENHGSEVASMSFRSLNDCEV